MSNIFYIPKFSIKPSCKIYLNVKKNCLFKDLIEEIKNLKDLNYEIKKLKFIQVFDNKLIRYIDENEYLNTREYIFCFEDETKKEEKTTIIPLYMYKNKSISSFPRLLFLENKMNFGQFKRKIYFYARKYFLNPFLCNINNKESFKNKVDIELEKYMKQNNYD